MITITIQDQNFNVKNIFALRKLIQEHSNFAQQIMEQAFATEENYSFFVESSEDLLFIQTFADKHLDLLFNIIKNSPTLLRAYSGHLDDLKNFAQAFPTRESEIYQLTVGNPESFQQLIERTKSTLLLMQEISKIFPKRQKETLIILSKHQDLLKSLVLHGQNNDLVLNRLTQLISFFQNNKEDIYSLLIDNFNFTAQVITGLVKLSPNLETELYMNFLGNPASFSNIVRDDQDYETLKQAFPKHETLLSFSHQVISNISDQKTDLITEIQNKFNAEQLNKDLTETIPSLKSFINKILADLRKDKSSEFKILIESLVALKVAMTKHEPQKSDLVTLCLHSMKKNAHLATYNFSILPKELIEKCEDADLEINNAPPSTIS